MILAGLSKRHKQKQDNNWSMREFQKKLCLGGGANLTIKNMVLLEEDGTAPFSKTVQRCCTDGAK
jgi:hypothetical protein